MDWVLGSISSTQSTQHFTRRKCTYTRVECKNCCSIFINRILPHFTSATKFFVCMLYLYIIKISINLLSQSCLYSVEGIDPWAQFHQPSTSSFYVRKLCAQVFCAYVIGLYFTDTRLLAQKLCLEHWNWALSVFSTWGVMVKLCVILMVKLVLCDRRLMKLTPCLQHVLQHT